jgi:hypothetical protein
VDGLNLKTRRHFFQDCGVGVGKIALASLMAGGVGALQSKNLIGSTDGGIGGRPNFLPRAKRVIYMFMAGAPSQLDLFDYKPRLAELEGQPIPPSVIDGQRYAFIQPDAAILGPQFKFNKQGSAGVEVSELLPWFSKIVDEVSILKSCTTGPV